MIFAEFILNTNESTWNCWKLNKPWATPSNGFVAAHDMIEHSPDEDNGTVEDEFKALGAGLVLRCLIADGTDIGYLISNDIAHILYTYAPNGVKKAPPYTQASAEYAKRFSDMKARFYNKLHREYPKMSMDMAQNALDWAYIGMNNALAKHGHRLDAVNKLFKTLRNIFDAEAKIFRHGKFSIAFDWDGTVDYQYIPMAAD